MEKPTAEELIVRIDNNDTRQCPLCTQMLAHSEFEANGNQLLQVHSLKCLNIGTESYEQDNGWRHITVGVFGR
jgi:hypothetical protein